MTDPDADGIYTWTESIRPGEYQYKYFNGDGGDPDGESSNFVTLGCGVDNGIGGTNRLLDITGLEMDTILPPYIYNACEVRITDAIDEIDLDAAYFIARPNPFNNMTTIAFNNRKGESFSFVLTNIAGQQLRRMENITTNRIELDRGNLASGVYFATLIHESGVSYTRKLMVD